MRGSPSNAADMGRRYCKPHRVARQDGLPHGILRLMRVRSSARAAAVWLACALLVGCPEDSGEGGSDEAPMKTGTTGEDDEGSSGSSGGDLPSDGQNVCLSAGPLPPGTYGGSLSGKDSSGGACAQGGPDVYFRIEIERRSDVWVSALGDGYEPRVGVFGNDCAMPFDEAGLLCVSGVPGWVSDVPAGTDLFIAVGASNSDVEGSRTGTFELDVATRNVLEVGERGGEEAWGRCETGSTCAVLEGSEGAQACVSIPGDRCGNAIDFDVDHGTASLSIEPGFVHTDAHRHACGGERSVERVYRLLLPEVSAEATLRIEGDDVLALAARGPTCLPEEERDCSARPEGTPVLTLSGELPRTLYLFVELPEPDPEASELSPSVVRLELLDD